MTTPSLPIKQLNSASADFDAALKAHLKREMIVADDVTATVSDILAQVRAKGDAAVLDYTNQFDGFGAQSMASLTVTREQMQASLESLDAAQREALEIAAGRIRSYHEKQKQESWQYREEDGSVLGQKVSPLQRVGVYAPGGKANYPSSILMLAIPAQVAGVEQIIATVPTAYGEAGKLVFAAAALAGVTELYTIGGAQAVAAMAYGTESIPKVDKITGPGNIYVTVAKRLVFGEVGIDMIAGPSELTIICDGETDPDWIAMDLFSQAEHDEQAQSILIATDANYLDQVRASIERLLPTMERRDIIEKSMTNRGLFILVEDLNEAARVSDAIAPEHLELSIADPESLLEKINHAGAIFMGINTCESVGDYCAGPNHVLPTSRTARFSSPLGVYDFQKRSSIINLSSKAASRLGKIASIMAEGEGLFAHARSADYRVKIDD